MTKEEISVRNAKAADVDQYLDLIMRMKRLNGEFDSLFKANEENLPKIKEFYKMAIEKTDRYITLVTECNGRMCGLLRADIRDRISYIPDKEVRIIDLYIMPEFRRKNVGQSMLKKLYQEMRELKIRVVSAEFPALNLIALNFYKKIGYREIGSVYGIDIDENQIS